MMVHGHKPPRMKDVEHEQAAFASRTFALLLILAALICVLIARMVYLMVFKHDDYRTLSEENRVQTVALAPTRGLIYDRNGVLLASNRTVFSAFVIAERTKDLGTTVAEVATLLELSEDELAGISDRLATPRRPLAPVLLKLNLSPRERAVLEVNGHRLHGVQVRPSTIRRYPFDAMMAHVVGSVRRIADGDLANRDARRYRATQFIGKHGVEAFYETSLHGEPGMKSVEVDVRGGERRELSRQKPRNGQNITLHLDSRLQIAASAALGQRRGAVVAIEPATGGIIAMASNPSYDPNLFVTGISADQYAELVNSRTAPMVDRATRGRYAPGSTFKPIVGLAGLALGMTDWERTIVDNGEFRLPGRRRAYRDWSWKPGNSGGQGVVDLRRAIYRSSNVYFYELGSRMPTDAMPDFAAQFGFGRVSSLDVAGADPGILPDSEWKAGYRGEVWYPGDNVNMAIGQGDLLVTPLQLATAVATIANRGRLVPPRLLRSSDAPLAEYAHEEIVRVSAAALAEHDANAQRRELQPEDWERMVDAMGDVVHRGNKGYRQNGTAWAYIGRDIRYRMAGKSGTAQVVGIAQGEEYNEDELDEYQRKHAWFMAFAPADAPQLAVAVLMENGGGGSSVAGPVAREVLDAYLLPRIAEETEAPLAQANAPGKPSATGESSDAMSGRS